MKGRTQHGWLAKIFTHQEPSGVIQTQGVKISLQGGFNDEPDRFDRLGRGTQLLALVDTVAKQKIGIRD